jgi:hypothetical protein
LKYDLEDWKCKQHGLGTVVDVAVVDVTVVVDVEVVVPQRVHLCKHH